MTDRCFIGTDIVKGDNRTDDISYNITNTSDKNFFFHESVNFDFTPLRLLLHIE